MSKRFLLVWWMCSLVLAPGLGRAVELHVNGETGNNANDGTTPSTAVKTLTKAIDLASEANCQFPVDESGFTPGTSVVHLETTGKPYPVDNDRYIDGGITIQGENGTPPITAKSVYVARRNSSSHKNFPGNASLVLRDVDWTGNGELQVGYADQNAPDAPLSGELVVQGGLFKTLGTGILGIGYGWGVAGFKSPVSGRFYLDGLLEPPVLSFDQIRCGYKSTPTCPVEGEIDLSRMPGSRIEANLYYLGWGGKPSNSRLLLAEDSTLRVGAKTVGGFYLCSGSSGGMVSTGLVSFARGGVLEGIANDFCIARSTGGNDNYLQAKLDGKTLDKVDLEVRTAFRVGCANNNGESRGLLDFSSSHNGRLDLLGDSYVAYNGNIADGTVLLGTNWAVRVGSPISPAASFSLARQTSRSCDGLFSMESGAFELFADEIRLGYACNGTEAKGAVDLGTADLSVVTPMMTISYSGNAKIDTSFDSSRSKKVRFDVDDLYVGYRDMATTLGRLSLGNGTARSSRVYLGNRFDPVDGVNGALIDLDGLVWSISERIELRRSARILAIADGRNAGLDLADPVVLRFNDTRTEVSGAGIVIDFRSLPPNREVVPLGEHDAFYHGLRWAGDHVDEVNALLADGKASFDTTSLPASVANAIGVFYDPATDATYLGCPVRYRDETTLTIRATADDERYEGAFEPPLGVREGIENGTRIECSASEATFGTVRYAPAGYVLERKTPSGWGAPVTNLGPAAFAYVHDGAAARLTWLWRPIAYRSSLQGTVGAGEVSVVPTPDGDGYHAAGTVVTLTPIPHGEKPAGRFLRWLGDVPAGHEEDVPLEVVVDRPLAISALFESIPGDIYVDGSTGNDKNAGTTPEAPFKTLGKGFTAALEATDGVLQGPDGRTLASSCIHVAPAATPYTFSAAQFVAGELTVEGNPGTPVTDIKQRLDIGHAVSSKPELPPNGSLLLRDIDWRVTSPYGTLAVGYERTGDGRAVDGVLETEGGSFVATAGDSLFIGVHDNGNFSGKASGKVVFGATTAPVELHFPNFRCGYQWTPVSAVEGLLDASAIDGGLIDARNFYVGVGGNPGVGTVLLGPNWTFRAEENNSGIRIGNAQTAVSSTGLVSFAEGGRFHARTTTFSVGRCEGGRGGQCSGILSARRLDEVSVYNTGSLCVGGGTTHGHGDGLIDFSEVPMGSWTQLSSVYLGYQGNVDARVLLGPDWTFVVGDEAVPVVAFDIGREAFDGGDALFSMKSGRFVADVNDFRVGYLVNGVRAAIDFGLSDVTIRSTKTVLVGYGSNHADEIHAVVDASASTNVLLETPKLQIGYREGVYPIYGRLSLGQGEGSVKNLLIGLRALPIPDKRQGLLELDGFRMAIDGPCEIRQSGQIRVIADGASAGPSLSPAATLKFTDGRTEETGPAFSVSFRSLPPNYGLATIDRHDAIYWGFRWAGDRVADLTALLADGVLAYETTGLPAPVAAAIGVFYDPETDATYLGCPIQFKEETTLTVRATETDEPYEGTFEPSLGLHAGLAEGTEVLCSASKATFEGNRYRPIGYVLERKTGDGWGSPVTNLAVSSFTYIHGTTAGRITWLWEDAAFRCSFETEGGSGELVLAPEPGATGYYEAGEMVTLRAVPSASQPRTRFVRWTGDVPSGMETRNPITVEVDRAMAISPVFETIPEEFYVDGETGLDTNGGSSPEDAFETLGKGIDTALDSNLLAAENDAGWNLGASAVHLAPNVDPYAKTARFYVNGALAIDAPAEGATALLGSHLDIGSVRTDRPDDPGNGSLALRNLDFHMDSANVSLMIGLNNGVIGETAADGRLESDGGAFSVSRGDTLWVGSYSADKLGAPVRGRLDLRGMDGTADLHFNNIKCAYQWTPLSPLEGHIDARTTARGKLHASYIGIGVGGAPGTGSMLLGTNWTMTVAGGDSGIRLGYTGGGIASTGILSFAEGGVLDAKTASLSIGHCSGGRGSFVQGRLLGPTLDKVSIHQGTGATYVGAGNEYGHGDGLVDFSKVKGGEFFTGGSVLLAYGGHATGKMLLGEDWTVRIGEPGAVAWNFSVGQDAPEGADGLFSMKSGRFEVYSDGLRIGQGGHDTTALVDLGRSDVLVRSDKGFIGAADSSSDRAKGIFDCSASTNVSFEVDRLWLGYRAAEGTFFGHLLLGRGSGRVSELHVGMRSEPIDGVRQGLLDLLGCRLSIPTLVELYRTAQIRVVAEKGNAGLDLARDAALQLVDERTSETGPAIRIRFVSPAEGKVCTRKGNHDSIYWGFRWAGDHLAEVSALVESGAIAFEASGLSPRDAERLGVFYDEETDATYIGLYTRQGRDGTLLLIR